MSRDLFFILFLFLRQTYQLEEGMPSLFIYSQRKVWVRKHLFQQSSLVLGRFQQLSKLVKSAKFEFHFLYSNNVHRKIASLQSGLSRSCLIKLSLGFPLVTYICSLLQNAENYKENVNYLYIKPFKNSIFFFTY